MKTGRFRVSFLSVEYIDKYIIYSMVILIVVMVFDIMCTKNRFSDT